MSQFEKWKLLCISYKAISTSYNKMYTHINKSTNALIHRGAIPRIKEDLEKYKVVAA